MPMGWWGVLVQARAAAVLVVLVALTYALLRGARRAWLRASRHD